MAALETRLLLVADTHLGFGEGSRLTSRIAEHLSAADAVLHAGDLNDASILEALRDSAPHADVYAVAGNTDGRIELPERITLELGGCAVGLVHNSGPASGRGVRLRRWFPEADLVSSATLTCPGTSSTYARPITTSSITSTPDQPWSAAAPRRAQSPRCFSSGLVLLASNTYRSPDDEAEMLSRA